VIHQPISEPDAKAAVRDEFKRRMRRFWPSWPDGERSVLITADEQEQYFQVVQERDAALNKKLGRPEPQSAIPDDWRGLVQFIRRNCVLAVSPNHHPLVLNRLEEEARCAALRIWRMFPKILPDIPAMLPDAKAELTALLPWAKECGRIIEAKMVRAINDGAAKPAEEISPTELERAKVISAALARQKDPSLSLRKAAERYGIKSAAKLYRSKEWQTAVGVTALKIPAGSKDKNGNVEAVDDDPGN
jgi:hypothetical protein